MAETILEFEKPLIDLEEKIEEMKRLISRNRKVDFSGQIRDLETKAEELKREIYEHLTPWQRVLVARHPNRPYTLDYIHGLTRDFTELHGDRFYGDDAAIVGGVARFGDLDVMIMGQQKGRDAKEMTRRNHGMPHPEGYRKALRLMKLAEKFKMPVISLIDTQGAYPGIGAEERGQAEAIARNLREMAVLRTPVVVVVIGEGGSGGALAMAVGDRVLMLSNAIYSVISPEGCATILWKDRLKAPQAAEYLKMTATDLLESGVIDAVIPEPSGGAHRNLEGTVEHVREAVRSCLEELLPLPMDELLKRRYGRFRSLGAFQQVTDTAEPVDSGSNAPGIYGGEGEKT